MSHDKENSRIAGNELFEARMKTLTGADKSDSVLTNGRKCDEKMLHEACGNIVTFSIAFRSRNPRFQALEWINELSVSLFNYLNSAGSFD